MDAIGNYLREISCKFHAIVNFFEWLSPQVIIIINFEINLKELKKNNLFDPRSNPSPENNNIIPWPHIDFLY